MTGAKKPEKATAKVGDTVEAKKVVRPNGSENEVHGGLYVLDVPGVFVVDGDEVHVK